ncbi:hypothetical protein QBC40DRAFT_256595 [Triangularia verruculosa]|uniref:Uncharacterized protein n=1 Tax=Triangularia verruculosa TaxID=2587418 RepID=A0AAN7AUG7_9PEZI|nr:hypothetical protein QBC40DRAFT_256595 [Triangularia verruculosa]
MSAASPACDTSIPAAVSPAASAGSSGSASFGDESGLVGVATASFGDESGLVGVATAVAVSRPPAAVAVSVGGGDAARAVEGGEQTCPAADEPEGRPEGEEDADTSGSSSVGYASKHSSYLTPGCDQGIGKVIADLMAAEEANKREWREKRRREEEERRAAAAAAVAGVGAWEDELAAGSAGVGPVALKVTTWKDKRTVVNLLAKSRPPPPSVFLCVLALQTLVKLCYCGAWATCELE